jgi:hypothetical protein
MMVLGVFYAPSGRDRRGGVLGGVSAVPRPRLDRLMIDTIQQIEVKEAVSIPLTNGGFAIVDAIDAPLALQFRWWLHKQYGRQSVRAKDVDGRQILLHRLVSRYSADGMCVYHRDGDPKNNRRENLRIGKAGTHSKGRKPGAPKNPFRGVHACDGKFRAYVMVELKKYYLGTHETAEEAARVRDSAVAFHYGLRQKFNFPDPQPRSIVEIRAAIGKYEKVKAPIGGGLRVSRERTAGWNAAWGKIKRRDSSRGKNRIFIEVLITKEDALSLYNSQNGLCALTGLPISFSDHTASLDRIDSDRHYEPGNVQWLHKAVNIMKNRLSQADFIEICHRVAEFHPRNGCLSEPWTSGRINLGGMGTPKPVT